MNSLIRCWKTLSQTLNWSLGLWFFLFLSSVLQESHAWDEGDLPRWRFFTTTDGFREAWMYSVKTGPSSRVWVTHGNVEVLSVYDGYRVNHLPNPGLRCSILESTKNQIWSTAWDEKSETNYGLSYFDRDQWNLVPIPEIQHFKEILDDRILPTLDGNFFILLPERLYLFQTNTHKMIPLRNIQQTGLGKFNQISLSRDGSGWIAGERGIAKITPKQGSVETDFNWIETLLDRENEYDDIEFIVEQTLGVIYGSARQISTGKRVLLRFDGTKWDVAYQNSQESVLMGWPDVEGGLWVIIGYFNNYEILRVIGNREQKVEKQKVLSGYLFRADIKPDGVFWLATSTGLTRHAPPLWSIPAPLENHIEIFNAINEDSQKRLYFVTQESVIVHQENQWDYYPIPSEWLPTDSFFSQGIGVLSDGRIAIGSNHPNLLLLNPSLKQFESIPHPEGHAIRSMTKRKDGGLWLMTNNQQGSCFLVLFDHTSFQTIAGPFKGDEGGVPRCVLETENGDLWLGGLGKSGLGIVQNGVYRPIGKEEGYDGSGALSLLSIGDGNIWIGERDRIVQTDGKNWSVILQNTEAIRSMIQARDGSIWIACGIGVFRFHANTWMLFDAKENLPDAAVYSIFEDSQNRIWAATTQGISLYHPENDREPPDTFISSDNIREVAPDGKARIGFYGSDKWKYTDGNQLLYSYRVDNQSWSAFQSNRDVTLSRLPFGKHAFEVRAMDRSENIDPTPARFEFSVLLPWYRETGFIVIMTLSSLCMIVLVVFAISRHFWLEHIVVQRTRDLQVTNESLQREIEYRQRSEEAKNQLQQQLVQSQKMEGIGRLAGGIAHDFNNILTAILGFSDLLIARMKGNDKILHDLSEIKKSALRAASLTHQLLAFSRKQVMQPKILNLNLLIMDLEKILCRLIPENIEISTHFDPALKNIKVDPTQIEQVIMNLCINARDAMPNGGQLDLETANSELTSDDVDNHVDVVPGSYVLLTISDTGTGIDKEIQSQIFEPFFTTKKIDKGTGLGLSTVYGIVKQSGGYIWIYSEPGHGTTFKTYFPVSLEELKIEKPHNKSTDWEKGKGTILLVEDEASVRSLAQRILEEAGFTVLAAGDGIEALAFNKRYTDPIHLLITDVIMPKMGGKELAQQVAIRHSGIRVLYVSGYTENVIVKGGFLEPNIQFLMKPFTPEAFLQKVREVLSSQLPH